MTDQPYIEPTDENFGGDQTWVRPKTPYDLFMEAEGVPVHRPIGIYDVRELELAPWARTGGKGAFLQLQGTEEQWGMYVLEIPPRAQLKVEHHLYEEFFYVLEGHGMLEVWARPGDRAQLVEWGPGSMIAIPMNAYHRLTNGMDERVLLLAATMAPPLVNIFQDESFIFETDQVFAEPLASDARYYEPCLQPLRDSSQGRAIVRSNFIPDMAGIPLPLDNQRAPGHRRFSPRMASETFFMFVAEYPPGRYSKAHYHKPGAVLVCLAGEGYTYCWPKALGTTPWKDGKGDAVIIQEYRPGGMVSAAPGGEDFFHQHFGSSRHPLRVLALMGLEGWRRNGGEQVRPGEELRSANLSLSEGGRSIDYADEDQHIREEFEARLAKAGASSAMPPEVYGSGG